MFCPGVAESAKMRKPPLRRVSIETTCAYAWLPVALCASSMTTQTISCAGHTSLAMSFTRVCGVRKSIRALRHACARSSDFMFPVSSAKAESGSPVVRRTEETC